MMSDLDIRLASFTQNQNLTFLVKYYLIKTLNTKHKSTLTVTLGVNVFFVAVFQLSKCHFVMGVC